MDDFRDIETSILTLIQGTYEIPVTKEGLRNWLLNGSTLLLLDGFDEMASKMDKLIINKNLEYLNRFLNKYKVRVILTCRTHFFKSQVEEQYLGNLLRLYLRDWGQEELEEYIAKSLPERKNASLNIIRSTYNLEELAKTPIFLNMITATIEDIGGAINQAKLYQIYTDRWIQSQDYRSKLSPSEKQVFMEEIALEMFLENKSRIDHDYLPQKIRNMFSVNEYDSIKSLDNDIRTCSFLIRNPEGYYYFVHKSFMEFFTGLKLAQEVKANNLDNFTKKQLTIEISGFFANYFEDDEDTLIRGLFGSQNIIEKINFALSLGRMRFSETIFNSLTIAIKTDKNFLVRKTIIDALALFNNETVAHELLRIASEETALGLHSLKKLSSFMYYEFVAQRIRDILLKSDNTEKVAIALDNIASSHLNSMSGNVRDFVATDIWKGEPNITKSLILAIQAIADLKLALSLKIVEDSTPDRDLRALIGDTKEELRYRFMNEIEQEAINNKNSGVTNYRGNERLVRMKYDFLVKDDQLKQVLDGLYQSPRKIGHQKGDRKTRTGNRR